MTRILIIVYKKLTKSVSNIPQRLQEVKEGGEGVGGRANGNFFRHTVERGSIVSES